MSKEYNNYNGCTFDPNINLYLKENEKFEIYMDPLEWTKRNIKTIEEDQLPILFTVFQTKIHNLLYSFINGESLSRLSILFFPLLNRINHSYQKQIDDLVFLTKNLNKFINFQNSTSILAAYRNDIKTVTIAKIIAALYSDFDNNLKVFMPDVKRKRITCRRCLNDKEYLSNDPSFLKPIIDLKYFIEKRFQNMLINYQLHGSMASLDYIKGWSDVDTLLIVKKKVVTDPKELTKLRRYVYESTKFFYQIDPLQHHGSFVLTEIDLSYYPQPYFPLTLFDHSLSFFSNMEIEIYERDSEIERLNVLWNTCYYFRMKYIENPSNINIFDLKMFLHILLLLPIAYLQVDEQYRYKKYSFNPVKKEFSEKDWSIVEKASRIRLEWKYKGIFDNDFSKKIFEAMTNPKIYFMLNNAINKQIPKEHIKIFGADYYKDASHLAEQILERGLNKK